jgi:hypothetical protein
MPEGRLCPNSELFKAREIIDDMWVGDGRKNVRILLRNYTTETMRYINDQVRGEWLHWPPHAIPADMQAACNAVSKNAFVGTDGWVKWAIGDTGEILAINFNYPYVGERTNRLVIENERKFHYETRGGDDIHEYQIAIGKLCYTVGFVDDR